MKISQEAGASRRGVLFVTHIDFWKRDLGSRMRLYRMLEYLTGIFPITIAYIGKREPEAYAELEKIGYLDRVIYIDELEESEVKMDEVELFLREYPVLKPFCDPVLYRKMETLRLQKSFESVIVEYLHLSYFLPLFRDMKLLLDSHDIMFQRNTRFKKNGQRHWIDISEEEELAIFSLYDRVLAIQKSEFAYLSEHNIPAILAPYSMKITERKNRDGFRNIVFVGGDTVANAEAIHWFLSEVWPQFEGSGLRLKIYGNIVRQIRESEEILRRRKIMLMGRVDDLSKVYLEEADAVINPVQMGGGLKIKNAEALTYGLPLITTSEGANGLEDGIEHAFLLADNKREWIERLAALMLSRTLRESLREGAGKYAENYFDEKSCYLELIVYLSGNKEGAAQFNSNTFIHEEFGKIPGHNTPGRIAASLNENVEELIKQMEQYLNDAATVELYHCEKAVASLLSCSFLRHPFKKMVRYGILAYHYDSYCKSPAYGQREPETDTLFRLERKLQRLFSIDLKRHPLQKLDAYKELAKST